MAADHLGRLLLTLYLCDYFTNSEFRREIHTILNRGKSVHLSQRATYYGKVPADRGRQRDEITAISDSCTLHTNSVLAWNTPRTQEIVQRWRKTGRPIEDAWLRRMGPGQFAPVNFRRPFRFRVERYAEHLLEWPSCAS